MPRQIPIPSALFQSLVAIDVNGTCIDLHNDYDCISFSYTGHSADFLVQFKSIRKNAPHPFVELKFEQVLFMEFGAGLETDPKCKTIDNIYRGRFEKEGELYEYAEDGKAFYYVEFLEAFSFRFFAAGLQLVL